mmetsp:Transcript_46833/g.100151  ORF Transcript_46833/g.100151 Transcript_46833/m.100151 type:complete len:275 (+) Transcript_46833:857-1681(+)
MHVGLQRTVHGLRAGLELHNLLLPTVLPFHSFLEFEVEPLDEVLQDAVLAVHLPSLHSLLGPCRRLVGMRPDVMSARGGLRRPSALARPWMSWRALVRHAHHRLLLRTPQHKHIVGRLDLSEQGPKDPVALDDLLKEVTVDLQARLRHGCGDIAASTGTQAAAPWGSAAVDIIGHVDPLGRRRPRDSMATAAVRLGRRRPPMPRTAARGGGTTARRAAIEEGGAEGLAKSPFHLLIVGKGGIAEVLLPRAPRPLARWGPPLSLHCGPPGRLGGG